MARTVKVTIIGDPSGLARAFGQAASSAQSFGARMQSLGGSIASTGATLTRGLTFPILALGGASAKMAMDFEASMNRIDALVGASSKQMDAYKEGVLDISRTTGVEAKELADALFFITSAGLKGADALDVLNASAMAADAGLGETKVIADAVTSAVNVYGSEVLEASQATDVLIAAVREGKMEPAELAANIGKVAPMAAEMGITFDQVGAALAAFSRQGTNAATGATQLRGLMSGLLKPSEQARDAFKETGITIEEMRKAVAEKGLLPALMDLRKAAEENGVAFTDLFPNVRALNAFLQLTGKSADANAKIFERLAKATGSTAEAFAAAQQTAKDKWEDALNSMKVAMIQFGGLIAPIIASVAEKIAQLVDKFSELSPATQKMIAIGAGIAAALGPALSIIGRLIQGFGLLASAASFLLTPWGLVVAGVAALAAGLIYLYTQSETVRNAINNLGSFLASTFAPVWDFVKTKAIEAWEALKSHADEARATVDAVVNGIRSIFEAVWPTLVNIVRAAWERIKTIVDLGMRALGNIIRLVAAILRGDWSAAWEALKGIASVAWDAIKAIVASAAEVVKATLSAAWSGLKAIASAAWEGVKSAVTSVWDAMRAAASAAGAAIVDGFMSGVNAVKGAFVAAWEAIKSAVASAIAFILDRLAGFISAVGDVAGALKGLDKILPGDPFGDLSRGADNAAKTLNRVADSLRGVEGPAATAARAVSQTLTEGFQTAASAVRTGAERIVNIMEGTVGPMRNAGSQAGRGASEGVRNGMAPMASNARSAVQRAISAVQGTVGAWAGVGSAMGSAVTGAFSSAIGGLVSMAVSAVTSAIAAAKAAAQVASPSRPMQDIGHGLAEGLVLGFLLKGRELPTTVSDTVRDAMERARQRVQDGISNVQTAFGGLESTMLSAFDRMASGMKTKTEKVLEQMDLDRRIQQLADRVAEAQQRLNEAMASGDQAQILAAQKALDDALYEQHRFNLERIAAEERKKLDERLENKRYSLEKELQQLAKWIEKHPEEFDKINKKIKKLMDAFGIDMQGSGQNIGKALARGLRDSIGEVTSAAQAVAQAIANALKTASPTKEGPMRDLDRWWVGFAPALISGLDRAAIRAAIIDAITGGGYSPAPLSASAAPLSALPHPTGGRPLLVIENLNTHEGFNEGRLASSLARKLVLHSP
jgi:TP901 family phage tail tape measure protein